MTDVKADKSYIQAKFDAYSGIGGKPLGESMFIVVYLTHFKHIW